jgi:hypothetical protein
MVEEPAIRSGFLAITTARAALAQKSDWLTAVKGDLQMHSVWSDGSSTIDEMTEAALQRKYE